MLVFIDMLIACRGNGINLGRLGQMRSKLFHCYLGSGCRKILSVPEIMTAGMKRKGMA